MAIQCAIVGLPNVGKSTLFNALTAAGIAAENYPFCTIDPNVGVVTVPDLRLQQIADIVKPQQVVPATVEFVDIAGLVAGASKGEGLGNKFLGNIRETHAIAHVVRCFENDDVVHVADTVDPLRDIDIINTELMLADLETTGKVLDRAIRSAKTGDKAAVAWRDLLQRLDDHLNDSQSARTMSATAEEFSSMRELHLLTIKPVMYVANVDESGIDGNSYVDQVREFAQREAAGVVVVCAALEAEIGELEDADRQAFLDDLGLKEPGLNRVICAGYELLELETYFTAGEKEVRAWTFKHGSTAPQAAGVIHTDFEKGFIRAEVTALDDFIAHGGENGAKEAGRLRLEGKDYVVQEGDVMHFRFNV